MVEQRALPVLQGWYARLRREGDIPGACQVATHIAFVCGGILEWGGELPTTPHGEIAPEIATSQRQIFGLLSTRLGLGLGSGSGLVASPNPNPNLSPSPTPNPNQGLPQCEPPLRHRPPR